MIESKPGAAVDDVVGREQSQPVKSRCNNGLRGIGEAGEGTFWPAHQTSV
jgi:hypothetical protein